MRALAHRHALTRCQCGAQPRTCCCQRPQAQVHITGLCWQPAVNRNCKPSLLVARATIAGKYTNMRLLAALNCHTPAVCGFRRRWRPAALCCHRPPAAAAPAPACLPAVLAVSHQPYRLAHGPGLRSVAAVHARPPAPARAPTPFLPFLSPINASFCSSAARYACARGQYFSSSPSSSRR